MMSKALIVLCAFVALMQSVSSQCCGSYVSAAPSCGCGNNLALNSELLPAGIIEYNDILTVRSGSNASPDGFRIIAENLELSGPVAVSGALPFVGTVGLSGSVPTGGQANVAYNTASCVGINNAGCGWSVPVVTPCPAPVIQAGCGCRY